MILEFPRPGVVVGIACALAAACGTPRAHAAVPIAPRHCAPVRMDTVHGTVFGVLVPQHTGEVIPPAYGRRIIAAVAARITDTLRVEDEFEETGMVIVAISAGEYRRGEMPVAWAGLAQLSTEIAFDVKPSGRLVHVHVVDRGDSAVTAVILRGVRGAGSLVGPRTQARRDLALALRLSLRADSGAIAQPLAPIEEERPVGVQRPVPRPTPDDMPRFPARDERDGNAAAILVSFVVDSSGRPVPSTMIIAPPRDPATAARYEDFARAVRLAAPAWRWRPANAGGCPVSVRIEMPILFRFAR